MAKYDGIVKLKGTIGNLSFYERKGVKCIRRPGGFTKERLQTDPRLQRVREHNTEFGAQSIASKSFRMALAPVQSFCDGTLHNRLMRIGARVTSLMEGRHGERPVAFSRVKPILADLQLDARRSLQSFFRNATKSVPSQSRNSAALQLNLNIPNTVIPPKGSTHFRLVHALAVISDVEFEPALGGFIPVAHEVDRLSARSDSDFISLKEESVTVNFSTTLPVETIPEKATVVEVLGIDFYQALGEIFAPFRQGKAAMVVTVF